VDAFIVRQNVQRALDGYLEFYTTNDAIADPLDSDLLDIRYFMQLSSDALPALIASFRADDTPASVKDALGASLACIRQSRADGHADTDWRSFHLSRWNEDNLLSALKTELKGYKVNNQDWPHMVTSPLGEQYNCGYAYWD
jgi:hypothetical protein